VAYRIDPTEPTDVGIRRVLAEQLGRAAEVLRVDGGPDAEAVHDVRKRLKKSRSALRLARGDLGAAVVRHANGELRRVGADLAQQRDAEALVDAVDRLTGALEPSGPPERGTGGPGLGEPVDDPAALEALATVRAALRERADAVHGGAHLDRAVALRSARTVEQALAWIERVPARRTGWRALAPGLERQYRRGREALAALPDEPSVDDLHEWRKRVKDLWYHERLLRRLWVDGQRPLVVAADELAGALGDDHDLGLLHAHVGPAPGADDGDGDDHGGGIDHRLRLGSAVTDPLPLDDHVRRLVSEVIDGRRRDLQGHARWLGERLYADEPEAWQRRHGAWWEAATA
jgi:CHAD domain-containing protein